MGTPSREPVRAGDAENGPLASPTHMFPSNTSRSRAGFQRDLERLQHEVLVLASVVAKVTLRAVDALRSRDMAAACAIEAEGTLLNRRRFDIEEAARLLIATQPVACDLRLLAAILHIVTDLERIGDYAARIAHISVQIGDEPLINPLVDVPRIAEKSTSTLRRSLHAFVERDAAAAERIAKEDDVDHLYRQLYRELLTTMVANPPTVAQATHLLWVAHNLARVADRVQNIRERVLFAVTGRMPLSRCSLDF